MADRPPQFRYLSHILGRVNPVYGNPHHPMKIKQVKSQERGDSCQTYWIESNNHWGTHIDLPAHFFKEGKRVTDYSPDDFIFSCPQVIEVQLDPGQLLRLQDLAVSVNPAADFLIFRSGWSHHRATPEYCQSNPGIAPDLANHLRGSFPKLRAIGIDWISVSSFLHREAGRETHRIFLQPSADRDGIFIVEDMNLAGPWTALHSAMVFPWQIEEIDSAPCTVVGVIHD